MGKKVLIVILILLFGVTLFSFFFFLNKDDEKSIDELLLDKGYSDNEVALILSKVSENDYSDVLELGYDKSLINILSSG